MKITDDELFEDIDFVPEKPAERLPDEFDIIPDGDLPPYVDVEGFFRPYIEKYGIDYVNRWKLRY